MSKNESLRFFAQFCLWVLAKFLSCLLFGSVVAVAFQITFHAEIHANDVFFFKKKSFLTLTHQNDPKHIKHIKF